MHGGGGGSNVYDPRQVVSPPQSFRGSPQQQSSPRYYQQHQHPSQHFQQFVAGGNSDGNGIPRSSSQSHYNADPSGQFEGIPHEQSEDFASNAGGGASTAQAIPESLYKRLFLQERADRLHVERLFLEREETHGRQRIAQEENHRIVELTIAARHIRRAMQTEADHAAELNAVQTRLEEEHGIGPLRRQLQEAKERVKSEREVVERLQKEVEARDTIRQKTLEEEEQMWAEEKGGLLKQLAYLEKQMSAASGRLKTLETTADIETPMRESRVPAYQRFRTSIDVDASSGARSPSAGMGMTPALVAASAQHDNTTDMLRRQWNEDRVAWRVERETWLREKEALLMELQKRSEGRSDRGDTSHPRETSASPEMSATTASRSHASSSYVDPVAYADSLRHAFGAKDKPIPAAVEDKAEPKAVPLTSEDPIVATLRKLRQGDTDAARIALAAARRSPSPKSEASSAPTPPPVRPPWHGAGATPPPSSDFNRGLFTTPSGGSTASGGNGVTSFDALGSALRRGAHLDSPQPALPSSGYGAPGSTDAAKKRRIGDVIARTNAALARANSIIEASKQERSNS